MVKYNNKVMEHVDGTLIQRADGFMATFYTDPAYASELPTGLDAEGLLTGSLAIFTDGTASMFSSITKTWNEL